MEINKKVFHPSFGYVTPEQMERLKEMPLGPERDMYLKQIGAVKKSSRKKR